MPNLTPPICSVEDVLAYRERIIKAAGPSQASNFEPLMTVMVLPDTDLGLIAKLAALDCLVSGKLYPEGLTINAQDSVRDFFALGPVFQAMQKQGLVLCLHGEMPGSHIMGRDHEQAFLRSLHFIARTYPDLRIVLEHITTDAAVQAVLDLPNVAATITVHHLMLTIDDVGGDKMCPNNYCKPIAKDPHDRDVLIQAAISGCPKFFLGSDSAPHQKEGKERLYDCCAGIFSAPVALALLTQLFYHHYALGRLQAFVSKFGPEFYDLPKLALDDKKEVTIINESQTVPDDYNGIVPFGAGDTIDWSVVS